MANLNKVMLIGRLTRDPESRSFSTGGKVTKFGFAVNNRRKTQEGNWEDEPVFLDVEVFNRGENKQADRAEQSLHKGNQVFIEGHLRMDNWTTQDGQKRSKIVVVIDNFQFLEPRQDGMGGGEGGGYRQQPRAAAQAGGGMRRPAQQPQPPANNYDEPPEMMDPPHGEGGDEIPF